MKAYQILVKHSKKCLAIQPQNLKHHGPWSGIPDRARLYEHRAGKMFLRILCNDPDCPGILGMTFAALKDAPVK